MWKPLTVKDKLTGEEVVIKDFRFNPELHEIIPEAVSFDRKKIEKEEVVDQKVLAKAKAAADLKEEKPKKKSKKKKK